jgi:hypothetical protein
MGKNASEKFFRVETGGVGYYLAGQVSGGGATAITREENSADGSTMYKASLGTFQMKTVTFVFVEKPEERSVANQDFDVLQKKFFDKFKNSERATFNVTAFDDPKYQSKRGHESYVDALIVDFAASNFDRSSTNPRSFTLQIEPKDFLVEPATGGNTPNPSSSVLV